MKQESMIRLVPDAGTAVLFIHGIVGTPRHFITQIPLAELVPENWSVYNVLLDGHGGSVDDFSRSSMKSWKKQVWEIFDLLCASHESVIIVGHSMGTLFATELALEKPEKIRDLFLLAVPLYPKVSFQAINSSLRLAFGRIREDRPAEAAIRDACGTTPTWMVWKYAGWIPRFMELLVEAHRVRSCIDRLHVSCVAIQSEKDELVSNSSLRLLQRNSGIQPYNLKNSGHFHYSPEDREMVQKLFTERIKKKA